MVDRCNRAAAGAYFDHLDDRDAQRQAAALLEAVDARDLEQPRRLRDIVVDQADLRRGPAHVERDHLVEAELARDMGREDGAAGRAGFDEADREADRRVDVRQSAAGQHQVERAGHAELGELRFEIAQIAPHQRLHIGVGAGRREALELAHLRRHLGGKRDAQPGHARQQQLAEAALMLRVGVGMDQADGDAFDAVRLQDLGDDAVDRGFIERDQHLALRAGALDDLDTHMARHERLRQIEVDVVDLEPPFGRDLQGVAEAVRGDERRACALALDQRVCGQRRAVDHESEIGGAEFRFGEELPDALDHRLLRCARRRQELGREPAFGRLEGEVSEGAADVDADARPEGAGLVRWRHGHDA